MSLAVQIKDTNRQLTVSAEEKRYSSLSTFPLPVGDAMTLILQRGLFKA